MRIPSSRVRWRTIVVITPKRPIAASATDAPANTTSSSALSRGCASGPPERSRTARRWRPRPRARLSRRHDGPTARDVAGSPVVRMASVNGTTGNDDLAEREVDRRARIAQVPESRVGHDAHDREGLILPEPDESLADRIARQANSAGRGLAQDHDGRRTFRSAAVKPRPRSTGCLTSRSSRSPTTSKMSVGIRRRSRRLCPSAVSWPKIPPAG